MRITERMLRYAVRCATPRTREWGQAMVAESGQVEGRAARARWELGATYALVRLTMAEKNSHRPRILFSAGIALTIIAIPTLALMVRAAYDVSSDTLTTARVISVDRSPFGRDSIINLKFLTVSPRSQLVTARFWSTESQESDALLTKYQVGTSHQICVRRTTRETFAVLPEGRNWRSNWLQNRDRTKAAKALGSSIAFAFLAVLATYTGWKRSRRVRQAVAA